MAEYRIRQQVWLRTRDSAYEEKLCHFLLYHYGDRMDVHVYKEYQQGMRPSGNSMLLTDDEADTEGFGRVIPLTLGEQEGAINLYQSGHRIAEQILECGEMAVAEAHPLIVQNYGKQETERRGGQVISVYSPVGGCGKTTFAMTLAECLSRGNAGKVLYLNLEGSSAWSLFYRNHQSYNLSDFLYSLLLETKTEEDFPLLLDKVVSHQENGVFFIQPCTSFEDLNILTPGETERLIRILQNQFSWILCDMNTAFHSVNRLFIQQSRRCFLISGGEKEALVKVRDFFQNLEIYEELSEDIKGKTRFLRRGGKGERIEGADDSLPENKELFYKKDRLWRLNRDSGYYQKVKEIAQEEMDCVRASGERLPVL